MFDPVRAPPHTGHLPAEDPHHRSLFRLHAGEKVGSPPVGLAARPDGGGHLGAGAAKTHS